MSYSARSALTILLWAVDVESRACFFVTFVPQLVPCGGLGLVTQSDDPVWVGCGQAAGSGVHCVGALNVLVQL